MSRSSNDFWTDGELVSAVEAYVFLLRLERSGIGSSRVPVADALLAGPLKRRNDASVRYRMH